MTDSTIPQGSASAIAIYAGFWRRVAAYALDSLILLVPYVVIALVIRSTGLTLLVTALVSLTYFAGFHSSQWQATPGKRAFGIKVTGFAGERIGLGRAIGRYFATLLSIVILGIGCLIAAFTRKRQALHDFICGTLVVNRVVSGHEIVAGGGVMRVSAGVLAVVILLGVGPPIGGFLAGIVVPASRDYKVRVKVSDVLQSSRGLQLDVERALLDKRAPAAGSVSVGSQFAAGATVSPEGEIVLLMADDVRPGGRIRLTPSVAAYSVEWTCRGEGMPPQLLPSSCRK